MRKSFEDNPYKAVTEMIGISDPDFFASVAIRNVAAPAAALVTRELAELPQDDFSYRPPANSYGLGQ